MKKIIFTDLDQTLLNQKYEFSGTEKILKKLSLLKIPVIPCTSKTINEILFYSEKIPIGKINNEFIAIAELGGAIYTSNWSLLRTGVIEESTGLIEYPVAEKIENIKKEIYESIPKNCKEDTILFTEATIQEIIEYTGLPSNQASMARQRKFDEVLIIEDKRCKQSFVKTARKKGLDVILGRKHVHVGKNLGKEKGIIYFLKYYKKAVTQRITTICLGDSSIDEKMLEICDYPYIIPWKNEKNDLNLKKQRYLYSPYPAPHGWSWIIEKLFHQAFF